MDRSQLETFESLSYKELCKVTKDLDLIPVRSCAKCIGVLSAYYDKDNTLVPSIAMEKVGETHFSDLAETRGIDAENNEFIHGENISVPNVTSPQVSSKPALNSILMLLA